MARAAAVAVLLGALASGLVPGAQAPAEQEPARVILLSIDAGASWIVDRLIDEGHAPAFAALAREGARASGLVSAMPSLTAPAHATLWTGAWSREHGVTGNSVPRLPRGDFRVTDSESGFSSDVLDAEPIWIAAARAGRRALVLQASGSYPFPVELEHLLLFDVYSGRHLTDAILEGRLVDGTDRRRVGGTDVLVAREGGGLRLETADGAWSLQPGLAGDFTPPVGVRAAGHDVRIRFRLLSFDEASGAYRLFHGAGHEIHASDPALRGELAQAAGALVGESAALRYRRGDFGAPIPEDGDGDAERWLVDLLAANQEYFTGALDVAAARPWDLLIGYVPNFDAAMHALAGMIDPASVRHSAALERRIWPLVRDLFARFADDYVAALRRRFPDATLLVVSDHGIEGAGGYVLPNVALRRAGLLALDERGRVDLARTRAVFVQGRGMAIFVNTTDWQDGIVPPEERHAVKRAVSDVLLSLRDPRSGGAAIRTIYDPETDAAWLGIGGPRSGDLYFDPSPGLYVSAQVGGDLPVIDAPPVGEGFHGVAPWRRRMHGIFYAGGPGVAAGRRLGLVRAVDVAPTVAALLGIPPPARAAGEALTLR